MRGSLFVQPRFLNGPDPISEMEREQILMELENVSEWASSQGRTLITTGKGYGYLVPDPRNESVIQISWVPFDQMDHAQFFMNAESISDLGNLLRSKTANRRRFAVLMSSVMKGN